MGDKAKVATLYSKILQNLKNISQEKTRHVFNKNSANSSKIIKTVDSRAQSRIDEKSQHKDTLKLNEPNVPRKQITNSHDRMLVNELNSFKVEVEQKYAKSASNKTYKFLYKCCQKENEENIYPTMNTAIPSTIYYKTEKREKTSQMSCYSNSSKDDFNPMKTQPVKQSKNTKSNIGSEKYCNQFKCSLTKNDSVGGTQNITLLLEAMKKNNNTNTKHFDTEVVCTLLKSSKTPEKIMQKSRNGIQGPINATSKFSNLTAIKSTLADTKLYDMDRDISTKMLQSYNSTKPIINTTSNVNINRPRKEVSRTQKENIMRSSKLDFNQTSIVKSLIKT